MKIKKIKAKSIITKSGLPGADFVINPYVGCVHGCLYCYARFMKRFTNHQEPWGQFVDVKINAPDLIPQETDKFKNKNIVMGSVTDVYQPLEEKYQLTRQILEKLIDLQPNLNILTKSDLVTRDIDLLRQFKSCLVSFSFSSLDDKLRQELEPGTMSVKRKIEALKKLHVAGIKTVLFVSPILPYLTDWTEIIRQTKDFVGQYWFENLNPYASAMINIYKFLQENKPELINKYREIFSGKNNFWDQEEQKIKNFCQQQGVDYQIYFHHKKS